MTDLLSTRATASAIWDLLSDTKFDSASSAAECLYHLGLAWLRSGETKAARKALAVALRVLSTTEDDSGMMSVLQALSAVYEYRGEFASAEEALQQALSYGLPNDDADVVELWIDLGRVQRANGHAEDAEDSFAEARRQLRSESSRARWHGSVADLMRSRGNWMETAQELNEAIEYWEPEPVVEEITATAA